MQFKAQLRVFSGIVIQPVSSEIHQETNVFRTQKNPLHKKF